jgi:hypothetical protein
MCPQPVEVFAHHFLARPRDIVSAMSKLGDEVRSLLAR